MQSIRNNGKFAEGVVQISSGIKLQNHAACMYLVSFSFLLLMEAVLLHQISFTSFSVIVAISNQLPICSEFSTIMRVKIQLANSYTQISQLIIIW